MVMTPHPEPCYDCAVIVRFISPLAAAAGAAFGLVAAAGPARASLTLNATGTADGLVLAVFATINSGDSGFGPFGLAANGNGDILVHNQPNETTYVFKDVNGQTVSSALSSTNSVSSGTSGYATAGGQAYGSVGGIGTRFVQFNPDGTVSRTLAAGVTAYLGMVGEPNGHILATSRFQGLIDINTVTNSFTEVIRGLSGDGLSLSANGKTAYLVSNGSVLAIDLVTKTVVHTYGNAGPSPDSTGVINAPGSGLNGDIVVSNNDGTLGLIDPAAATYTQIASAGTRLDYTFADASNGSLLIDGSNAVYRLTCTLADCSIGSPPPASAPEPATMALLGTALVGLAVLRRRHRSPD